jgi:RHS repeat-associated protein
MRQQGLSYTNNTLLDSDLKNKYLFNGKELDDKTNFYEYGFRDYDAQLARWHVVDPSAESYIGQSPYHFAGNSPVNNIELNGADYYDYGSSIASMSFEEEFAEGMNHISGVSEGGGVGYVTRDVDVYAKRSRPGVRGRPNPFAISGMLNDMGEIVPSRGSDGHSGRMSDNMGGGGKQRPTYGIKIWYPNPSNDRTQDDWLSYTYGYNQEYNGPNNDFVEQTVRALDFLLDNDIGTDVIKFAMDVNTSGINIQQTDPTTQCCWYTKYEVNGYNLFWDPYTGLYVGDEDASETGLIPPVIGLLHELAHFRSSMLNPERYNSKPYSFQFWNFKYSNPEEKFVIQNVEWPAARKLNLPLRFSHNGGIFVNVSDPLIGLFN